MKSNANKDLQSTRSARSGAVGYTTVANAMPATRESAPYLGRTHVSGSCTQDYVAERIAASKGAPIGVEEVKRVWNAVGGYLLDRMPDEPSSYDLGFARVRPSIGGKFPSMDSAFDKDRNRLYVAVVPSEDIRNALGGSSPTRDGDAEGEPEIGNVIWNGNSQTLKSGEPFEVLGNALTLDSGDESAELSLPGGDTVPVTLTVVAAGNWQRLIGRLERAVEACDDAVLTIRTHGYDEDSGLKAIKSKSLTVLAGETPPGPTPVEPEITMVQSMNEPDDTVNVGGDLLYIYGSGLNDVTEAKLYNSRGSEEGTVAMRFEPGSEIIPPHLESVSQVSLDWDPDGGSESGCKVSVTTAGGTAEHTVTVVKH